MSDQAWLQALLFDAPMGIYIAPSATPLDDIATEVSARGWDMRAVSLADIGDKAALLEAVGTGLDAHEGWGRNWDAFVDILRDLPSDNSSVLVLDDCGDPATRCPSDWATMIDILRDHIADHRVGDGSLRVVLRSDDPAAGYCAL